MFLHLLMLFVGCSASLFAAPMINNEFQLIEANVGNPHKRHSFHSKNSHANKTTTLKSACIQLDFSNINIFQASNEPPIGPNLLTTISGIPSNASKADYNPLIKAIQIPPGIYSIRCSGITDVITINGNTNIVNENENISAVTGYVTIYYSLNNGLTWTPIVNGNTSNIELLNITLPSFDILFPFTETLVTVNKKQSITFAYGVGSVNGSNLVISRVLSGRFIVEQMTSNSR